MRISKRFQGRPPYSPGGQPCPVILNANESFVRPSAEMMAEFHAILDSCDFNRYPDPRAEELCRTYADLYGLDWQNVTAGNGSDEHIELLYAALVGARRPCCHRIAGFFDVRRWRVSQRR